MHLNKRVAIYRPGSLMLELAPVSPESSNSMGARNYVWDRKQVRAFLPTRLSHLTCTWYEKDPLHSA